MPVKRRGSPKAAAAAEANEIEVDPIEEEEVDDLDGGRQIQPKIVGKFIRMWPRSIFNTASEPTGKPGKAPVIGMKLKILENPGVYILYRDDQPFYVGQTKGKLRSRLRGHANGTSGLRTYFWNYFSAFVVDDPDHIDEVEAILISAMPAVISNSAAPRLPKERMGQETRSLMRQLRQRGQY